MKSDPLPEQAKKTFLELPVKHQLTVVGVGAASAMVLFFMLLVKLKVFGLVLALCVGMGVGKLVHDVVAKTESPDDS